jgi:hypothetical protein
MFGTHRRLFHYLAVVALLAFFLPKEALAQKSPPPVAFAPPTLSLTASKSVVTTCEGSAPQVQLNAPATSPAGNPIRYRWTTTSGRINGEGPSVVWDLAGVAPGVYKATINIQTGNIQGECEAFTSTVVVVKGCAPAIQPACPNVEMVCPTNVAVDQRVTFSANVYGGIPLVSPAYNWTVSAGSIIEGQGTSSINVDTTGLAGQMIKATLSLDGQALDCSASCGVAIPLPQAKCRKFDEFPAISRNDEKARLDNYGIDLQNDPTSTAYVVIYPQRSAKSGEAQRRSREIVDYLVNARHLDAKRIVSVVGGARDELRVELWTCPQGTTPPQP